MSMDILKVAKSNWFLIGVIVVIFAARWDPHMGEKGGYLKPEITVKYLAVTIIFLLSGLSLRTEDLRHAILQVNVHIFFQSFTFIFFPLFIHVLIRILQHTSFDNHLLDGLTVLSCLPPPVSSAVILTKAVGGNEAASIFNSALGSFLGIFATPPLLLATVGTEGSVPAGDIVTQLTATVLVPLACGQMLRTAFQEWLMRANIPFSTISSGVLLFIIYTVFCDTFANEDVHINALSLFVLVFIVVCLQMCLLLLIFCITTIPWFEFSPSDVIALMFCCTHKSLTLGIPIIKVVFSKLDDMSLMTIPLLIYHPTQILLGGALVPVLGSWLASTSATFRPRNSRLYPV